MMSVVEPNDWDEITDGVNIGDEQFADILDILDLPIENLEADGDGGDWDASKFQNLGPIPIDALTGLPPILRGNISHGSANRVPSYNTLVERKPAEKGLPNYVGENSGTCTPRPNPMSSESTAFQTPSPVSVLESSGSCSSAKSLSVKSEIVIPVRARSKRSRPPNVNPWFLIPPVTSVSKKTSGRGENKDKKKRNLPRLSNTLEGERKAYQQAKEKAAQELDDMEGRETLLPWKVVSHKCTHCEVTKTPQWREGPQGPKTLCNACGVRYRSGRLFPEYRPAASPTFIPSIHSNSHKKVIEMRKKGEQQGAETEELPMSPVPEFIPMSSHLVSYMC